MKTYLLFMVFLMSVITGYGKEQTILEMKDIQNFSITETRSSEGTTLEISGLVFHGALAVEDVKMVRECLYLSDWRNPKMECLDRLNFPSQNLNRLSKFISGNPKTREPVIYQALPR